LRRFMLAPTGGTQDSCGRQRRVKQESYPEIGHQTVKGGWYCCSPPEQGSLEGSERLQRIVSLGEAAKIGFPSAGMQRRRSQLANQAQQQICLPAGRDGQRRYGPDRRRGGDVCRSRWSGWSRSSANGMKCFRTRAEWRHRQESRIMCRWWVFNDKPGNQLL
jgi:hypothetical protein